MKEKNPSWIDDDWCSVVMWTRSWRNKNLTLDGEKLRKELEEKGNSLMKENREKFSLDGMTTLLNEIVERHTKDLPSEVGIKLPKLKKSNSGNSGKINLPKLKKPETTESEATTV